jgi:hypothetical protein
MTVPERRSPGPIVIETPAQAAILLHLLDDLAVVLDLAAKTGEAADSRRAYAAQLAGEVRAVRAELCPPDVDPPGMGYGAREWREALCAALDQVPLQQAGLALQQQEAQGDTGPR